MKVHEQEMNSPLFDDVENLKPVIQQGASDSAALDNVFELLNISGQPAPVPKAGGFISFSPVNRPRAFMSFIQLEGILANLRQKPCFPGVFQ